MMKLALDAAFWVSLFTREWIEITILQGLRPYHIVSLFTREWIEIVSGVATISVHCASPSLRGSGLKFIAVSNDERKQVVSLFTREWIEIAGQTSMHWGLACLPLYEGVD